VVSGPGIRDLCAGQTLLSFRRKDGGPKTGPTRFGTVVGGSNEISFLQTLKAISFQDMVRLNQRGLNGEENEHYSYTRCIFSFLCSLNNIVHAPMSFACSAAPRMRACLTSHKCVLRWRRWIMGRAQKEQPFLFFSFLFSFPFGKGKAQPFPICWECP
jgi:hypothetical protein